MGRWPTGSFSTHRTGGYGAIRTSSSDGACGVHGYPCIHWGMDLFADENAVGAPEDAQVVAVSDGNSAPWVGYGPGVVVLQGASGVFHLLGHLNPATIGVAVGAQLAEGDPIAQFDAAIGHTHYEVRQALTGPSDTNTIDPEVWVGGMARKISIAIALGVAGWLLTRLIV